MPIKNDFKDKVVVVTGASAGLGRAIACEFASHGAHVVLLARGEGSLRGARSEVERRGGKALIIPVDVADPMQVEQAADRIEREAGPIDIWINNAMVSVFAPVKEVTAEEFRRVTEVTYLGQVYGTMSALKRMLPRNRGTIILVGSALAYRGIPLQSAYCGAKHGIQGFFDSLRTELLHDKSGVTLSMVQLPAMNTTQFGWVLNKLSKKPKPMGTIYQPEVAARAIVFAAAHHRRELWVGFSTYIAIIGNRLMPWYADRRLARTGYQGQLTDEPEAPDHPNNLWDPVPGDHGAHGPFDAESRKQSVMLRLSEHRLTIGIGALIVLILILFWILL